MPRRSLSLGRLTPVDAPWCSELGFDRKVHGNPVKPGSPADWSTHRAGPDAGDRKRVRLAYVLVPVSTPGRKVLRPGLTAAPFQVASESTSAGSAGMRPQPVRCGTTVTLGP